MGFDWEGILGEEGYAEVCAHGLDTYGYSRCYATYGYSHSRCNANDYFGKEDFNSDDSSEE